MNKEQHEQIIHDRIQREAETLLPNGAGVVSAQRLTHCLQSVATIAFREGQSYALLSLMTVEDVAQQFGVSERRVRALALDRHQRLGIGWQVPGTSTWLFRPEEVEHLRPGPSGRPKRSGTGE